MEAEILGKHQVAAYKEYSGDIHRSGEHLLGLINDVLDLSRIEAGQLQITEEDIDIAEIGRECCHLMQLRADAQGVTVTTEFDKNLPIVRGDARAIRQIWINLLTNAIKFSARHAQVKMIIHRDENGDLRFGVHDTGVGISESEINKVVEAFQQGAAGLAQAGSRGTGLGLSIVKGLLEAHEGRFEIRSKLGKGTQAEAIFPASRLRDIHSSSESVRIAG